MVCNNNNTLLLLLGLARWWDCFTARRSALGSGYTVIRYILRDLVLGLSTRTKHFSGVGIRGQ